MSIEPDEAAACIAVQPSASLACQIVGKRLSKAYISVMYPRLATSNIRATDASYRADEGEPARGAPPPAASDAISASLAAFGSVAPSAGEGIAAEERRGEGRGDCTPGARQGIRRRRLRNMDRGIVRQLLWRRRQRREAVG